ncbi:MAG: hypothetical protein QME66_08205 [Candidatus Eisenbacteria bacterium]|nr:hypothetical protein [Candidatus Eisenbacteria bacterium]
MTNAIRQRKREASIANFMIQLGKCRSPESVQKSLLRFSEQWPQNEVQFVRLAKQRREAILAGIVWP